MLFFKILYKHWRIYMIRNHVPVPEIEELPTTTPVRGFLMTNFQCHSELMH